MIQSTKKNIPHFVRTPLKFLLSRKAREKYFAEAGIRKIQNANIARHNKDAKKLIIFCVPGPDRSSGKEKISGGIISIVSICEESARLQTALGAEVLMCTLPNEDLLLRHRQFANSTDVFRFAQLKHYFSAPSEILLHLPEFTCDYFLEYLPEADRKWLLKAVRLHINILNQNVRLMPGREVIEKLEKLATIVTTTTAHQKYCTPHFRQVYGIPIHKLSVWISPEQYTRKPYDQKNNLMVVSPDQHPAKDRILALLQSIPGLTIQIIRNLTYEQYKSTIATAKWSLTFGEGLDGYFIEPIFSGAVSFAVYNQEFFTEDYKDLPGVFGSFEQMEQQLVSTIAAFDRPDKFAAVQQQQFDVCATHYNQEVYRQNILKFYEGQYTYN